MPIRPENRGRYPDDWRLGTPLSDLITPDEHRAALILRESFGADPSRTYQFWERLTARMLDGELTPPSHPWDVQAGSTRVEVKFSQEFVTRTSRRVYRWVGIDRTEADATVLFGIDRNDLVSLWVAPPSTLAGSALVTCPDARIGHARSPICRWRVPTDQLLPAVVRCHLHYDKEHHAETRAATKRADLEAQMEPLFGEAPC